MIFALFSFALPETYDASKLFGNSKITLKGGRNNQYCSSSTQSALVCEKSSAGPSDSFVLKIQDRYSSEEYGTQYSLEQDGQVCTVVKDNENRVVCNQKFTKPDNQLFTVYPTSGNQFNIIHNGKYCSDDVNGFQCKKDKAGIWETFTWEHAQ
jgi:frataxin-like iron-binding protein CyaY